MGSIIKWLRVQTTDLPRIPLTMITRWSADESSALQLHTSLLPSMDSLEQIPFSMFPFSFSITCDSHRQQSGVKRRKQNAFNPRESTRAGRYRRRGWESGPNLRFSRKNWEGKWERKCGETRNVNGKSVRRGAVWCGRGKRVPESEGSSFFKPFLTNRELEK